MAAADSRPMTAAAADDARGLDSATTARESVYQSHQVPVSDDDDGIRPAKDEAGLSSTSGRDSSPMASSSRSRSRSHSSSIGVAAEKGGEVGEGPEIRRADSFLSPLPAALDRKLSQSRNVWKFHMRAADDDEPEDWWFASTAIPLLAATIGPMANVLSIAALVTSWRMNYSRDAPDVQDLAVPYPDPPWCIGLNATSLALGFVGNFFLLCNFTRRIRYIVALPLTIVFWALATGMLIGITAAMHVYASPLDEADGLYSQGFWCAIIAAVLYLISALLLMVNMLGYALGHYTQHFDLSDDQRNLILQTMMFFLWLAGGGAVFARINGWPYADGLYFCDVTILTVGFGDFAATNDLARGLVFPYSVGGIIILGLMVSSIRKFAQELGHDKVVRRRLETRRERTVERSVGPSPTEAETRQADLEQALSKTDQRPSISAPFDPHARTVAFSPDVDAAETLKGSSPRDPKSPGSPPTPHSHHHHHHHVSSWSLRSPTSPFRSPVSWASSVSDDLLGSNKRVSRSLRRLRRRTSRRSKLLVLREEKDRFDAMRAIQHSTKQFKRYFALTMSIIAFGLLWCVGAVVFWKAEESTQGLSYFQALYFCYVSLLTIGYGDLSPKSNAGKPFFIVWSLVAVPTMTILISDMGDTVVASYKQGTFTLADWTLLPQRGILRQFLGAHPKLDAWIEARLHSRAAAKRVEAGFPVGPEGAADSQDGDGDGGSLHAAPPTLEELAREGALDEHALGRRLTHAIRRTAHDLRHRGARPRRYSYEEWVEFTRLIRFTAVRRPQPGEDSGAALDAEEADEGIVKWDWIGDDSPMMAEQAEGEWILDRLCESLERYMRRQEEAAAARRRPHHGQHRNRRRANHDRDDGDDGGDDDDDVRAARRPGELADGIGGGSVRRRSASAVGRTSATVRAPARGDPAPGWLGPSPARHGDGGRQMQSIAGMRMKQL